MCLACRGGNTSLLIKTPAAMSSVRGVSEHKGGGIIEHRPRNIWSGSLWPYSEGNSGNKQLEVRELVE